MTPKTTLKGHTKHKLTTPKNITKTTLERHYNTNSLPFSLLVKRIEYPLPFLHAYLASGAFWRHTQMKIVVVLRICEFCGVKRHMHRTVCTTSICVWLYAMLYNSRCCAHVMWSIASGVVTHNMI